MIEPFRLAFDLRAPQDHAFDVYTRDIDRWWPASHTQTGRSDLRIVMEGRAGGRIFEQTPEGDEFDWGRVQVWEPPGRLVYSWHLRRDPAEWTEVAIVFTFPNNEADAIFHLSTGALFAAVAAIQISIDRRT